MSDKTEKYDQYGRPYDNPTDLASADALARRYVNGELPMPNQVAEVDADPEEVVADYQERWERIIDQDALELELLRRNPKTSYPSR